MTLEQILALYYFPTSQYKFNDHVGRDEMKFRIQKATRSALTGDITWNDGLFVKYNVESVIRPTKGDYNLILDFPKQDIHIEGLRPSGMGENNFVFSRMWFAKQDVYYADIILSLRLGGYLVDCWQGPTYLDLTRDFVSFNIKDLRPVEYRIPEPLYQTPLSAFPTVDVICKKYKNESLKLGSRAKEITYRYVAKDGTHVAHLLDYFHQHPRNFFLSFVK